MEPSKIHFPRRQAGIGALLGLALGAFVAVPWGTLVAPDGQGSWLACFMMLSLTLIGAWFAIVVSLSAVDEAASEHEVHPENEPHMFDGHERPITA